jgi:hypothetical protein
MATPAYELFIGDLGTEIAGEALTSDQYKVVTISSTGVIKTTVQGQTCIGILQNNPASGATASVRFTGVSRGVLGGSVNRGDRLTCDTAGKLVAATLTTDYIVGIAMSTGVASDIIPVTLALGSQVSYSAVVDGLAPAQMFRATFDPSATSGQRTIAAHGLGVTLPIKSIVTWAGYVVYTTFTSSTDAATIALGLPTDAASGIKAAVAISNGANPWDAGNFAAVPIEATPSTWTTQLTAAREVTATVAVEALTAGKLVLWGRYIIGA